MFDTYMTIIGNVVEAPKLRRTKSGVWVGSFRIASTPRRFDRGTDSWSDGKTLYVSVTCWRGLGENVAQSLSKGQPVIVSGRYVQKEYEHNEQLRVTYELDADVVGHDLSKGVSSFEKVSRRSPAPTVELDADGIPADQSAHYLDLDEEPPFDGEIDGEIDAEIDTQTGEIRELTPTA